MTFTEILVVLGVLVLLAILVLIPVFEAAKLPAKSTQCISKGKQIGTALAMYAADYDDRLPAHVMMADGRTHTLPSRLHSYIQSEDIWRCPEAPAERAYDDRTPGDTTVSYGYNWLALEEGGCGVKQSTIKKPGATVAFAESTSYLCAPDSLGGASGTLPNYAHTQRATVIWLDGHVKAEARAELECTPGTENGRSLQAGIDSYEFWNRR